MRNRQQRMEEQSRLSTWPDVTVLISNVNLVYAVPGDRAVWGMCLGPPGCWDRGSNPVSDSPDNDSAGMIRLTQRHYPRFLLGYIPISQRPARLRTSQASSWEWVCRRSLDGILVSNPAGRHGCLSLLSVVCCQVEVSVTSWSLVQRSPSVCSVSNECDSKTL
jgi:hypothetical protein